MITDLSLNPITLGIIDQEVFRVVRTLDVGEKRLSLFTVSHDTKLKKVDLFHTVLALTIAKGYQ